MHDANNIIGSLDRDLMASTDSKSIYFYYKSHVQLTIFKSISPHLNW